MFRGSDSDIVERMFSYDTEPGELTGLTYVDSAENELSLGL